MVQAPPIRVRYLDAQELANWLGISRAKVYRLASDGELPGTQIGVTWRFSEAAIQRLIEGDPSPKDDDTR